MPVTFIGQKSGVGPVLKVMRNNADNPLTTPITDFEKFNFDSESRDYAYIKSITKITSADAGWSGFTWKKRIADTYLDYGHGGTMEQQTTSWNAAWAIQKPLFRHVDVVYVEDSTGYQCASGWYKYQASPARYRNLFQWYYQTQVLITGTFPISLMRTDLVIVDNSTTLKASGYFLVVEWDLPVDETARGRAPAPSLTAGTRVLEFSPTRFRLAAPGYDVRTATQDQLIFSEAKSPVGCIASGTITLSGTTGSVSIPVLTGANYFVDLQWNESGQPRRIPYFRDGSADINVKCRVSGSSLEFLSTATSPTVTYHVYAYGEGTPDTSSPIRMQSTDFLRIWRGPVGGPVLLKDVIFDSRLRYPRVVSDQHWLTSLSGNGNAGNPTPFSYADRGYIPIIKSSGTWSGALSSVREVMFPKYDTVGTGTGYGGEATSTLFSPQLVPSETAGGTTPPRPTSFAKAQARFYALTI
jgi:hypothetical protein